MPRLRRLIEPNVDQNTDPSLPFYAAASLLQAKAKRGPMLPFIQEA